MHGCRHEELHETPRGMTEMIRKTEVQNDTWRAGEEDSFGELAAKLGELVGVLQVLHHLLQLGFGLWAPLHILEGLLVLFRHVLLHTPMQSTQRYSTTDYMWYA